MTLAERIIEAVMLLFAIGLSLFVVAFAAYYAFWIVVETVRDLRKQKGPKPKKDTRTDYEKTLDNIRHLEHQLGITHRRNT